MKQNWMMLMLVFLTAMTSCKKEGCTDEKAENYVKRAKVDDGSCIYADGVIAQEITTDISSATIIGDKTIRICGDISVTAGLTLSPGSTVIMCEGSSIHIESGGFITAAGTASNPIVIKGETETPGFWEGIMISSNNPNNRFSYVTVKDAGSYWGWDYANVKVADGAQLDLKNSTISNSLHLGMYIGESAILSGFSDNTFSNNETGLNLSAKHVHLIDANSVYNLNCVNNFIYVRSAEITNTVTWPKTTAPLLVNSLTVSGGLTLSAGSLILVEADSYFDVTPTGYLKSSGTSTAPVSIAGRYNTTAYWYGINFRSTNTNNQFTYTTVRDAGGYWGYEYTNIYVEGRLSLDNCTISNANSY
jgi:hypothetical protein